jgi:hypothetical protein
LSAGTGTSVILYARTAGTGRISADPATGGTDQTGDITVTHADSAAYYEIRASRVDPIQVLRGG